VHRRVHLLDVCGVHLDAERREHGVDSLDFRDVEPANLRLVPRLDDLRDLIEVRADGLRAMGGARRGASGRRRGRSRREKFLGRQPRGVPGVVPAREIRPGRAETPWKLVWHVP